MARLSISMKGEMVKILENEAATKGKTVSSILSEAASLYIEADRLGIRSEDILRTLRIVEIMREIDAVPVPVILLDKIVGISLKSSEDEVMPRWFERGLVLGNILRTYAKGLREFSDFIREYKFLIPIGMFETEFDENNVQLVVSGVGNSLHAAKCTSEGLRGLLYAYGYRVNNVETSEGFIKIKARECKD